MTITSAVESTRATRHPSAPPGSAPPQPTPAHPPQQEEHRRGLGFGKSDWALATIGGLLATGVSSIGLASSYRALQRKAAQLPAEGGWGWENPWMLPVGLDLSILAFSIINLVLIRADRPLPWVKWIPRLGAVGTIYLNWQSAVPGPSQFGHAALVALWVVFSEIAAHLYAAHIGAIKGRAQMERIRLARWFHAPFGTFRIFRTMKTWEITDYKEALDRDRGLMVYRSGLRSTHGRWWRFKASENELQPLRLAAYGMTIDEALEEPNRQNVAEAFRKQNRELQEARSRLQRIEAESEVRAAELQAEAAETRAKGQLAAARAEADAAASVAVQRAEADLQVRRAEADAEAARVAAEAQAKVQQLEVQQQTRKIELEREKEKEQLTWETERERLLTEQQAERSRRAAEAQQRATEKQLKESAEAATARRIKMEEDERAATLEKRAAEARREKDEALLKAEQDRLKAAQAESEAKALDRQAAEDEAAAQSARLKAAEDAAKAADLEAEARMTQAERESRKVADLIRAEGLKAVPLTRIAQTFGHSEATASGRRKRAVQILKELGELPAEAA